MLALDEEGAPRPFQDTMRRFGRVQKVAELRRELPLTPVFFDCLMLDDQLLIDAAGTERRAALEQAVPPQWLVQRLVTADPTTAADFMTSALQAGHEGLMAKTEDNPYVAGSRSNGWLKVKPVHTLDLVVLAAEWGSGRRRGWLSNLHLGARDPDGGDFVMLGKTFKGMTDEILAWQTEALQAIETSRNDWTVHVTPTMVVEIAFNDIQQSPHYPGGVALRFARLVRYRPDKSAQDADTITSVRDIHARGFSSLTDR